MLGTPWISPPLHRRPLEDRRAGPVGTRGNAKASWRPGSRSSRGRIPEWCVEGAASTSGSRRRHRAAGAWPIDALHAESRPSCRGADHYPYSPPIDPDRARLRSILIERLKEHSQAGRFSRSMRRSSDRRRPATATRQATSTSSSSDRGTSRGRTSVGDRRSTHWSVPSTPGPGITRVSRRSPNATSRAYAANAHPSSRTSGSMESPS